MKYQEPAIGETRIIRRFALFPISTRSGMGAWLEWVNIKQRYSLDGWINLTIIDEPYSCNCGYTDEEMEKLRKEDE
jgi:hypothetical protein